MGTHTRALAPVYEALHGPVRSWWRAPQGAGLALRIAASHRDSGDFQIQARPFRMVSHMYLQGRKITHVLGRHAVWGPLSWASKTLGG